MFDTFISHAWEDKDDFVRPLADALSAFGVEVWYDEFALKVGDSLSKSLDKGLTQSRFGVVVLSKSFLQKNWTDYELRSLLTKEVTGNTKTIIPVLHQLTPRELAAHSPYLADKIHLNSDIGISLVTSRIIEVVRPDIFERVARRSAFLEQMKEAETKTVQISKVQISPHRHQALPPHLISRIRLLRAALLGVYAHSMDFWIDGFRRDAHPSREVRIWEHVASCYLEMIQFHDATPSHRKLIFAALVTLSNGYKSGEVNHASELPVDLATAIEQTWFRDRPIYEVDDKPFDDGAQVAEIDQDHLKALDVSREQFPFDLPDELIAQVVNEHDAERQVALQRDVHAPPPRTTSLSAAPKSVGETATISSVPMPPPTKMRSLSRTVLTVLMVCMGSICLLYLAFKFS